MRPVLIVFVTVALLSLVFRTVCSGVVPAAAENPHIFFDKSVYYPDASVFWNLSVSIPVRITVEDNNADLGYVEVSFFSSIDAKIVTLAETAQGRFEVLALVNCLRLNESVSNVGLYEREVVLNALYGDEITARYLGQVEATALVLLPRYVLSVVLNAPWSSSWQWFDSEGVPLVDYGPPIGMQYNPSTICHYALCSYYAYLTTGNSTFKEKFLVQANWLARNAVRRGNFSVWEYRFDWSVRNCTSPWVSAMAQGEGLSVLTRAYVLTQNATYLDVAQTSMRSFEVEMTSGGVRHTDSDGIWFEEYADIGAISSKVLNGFIYSLYGLFEYSFETKSSEGSELFNEGARTLSSNLYRYDTGSWSYYDLQYHSNASQDYHWLHVVQLMTLHKITGDQTFRTYGDRFNTYMQKARTKPNETGPSLKINDDLNQLNATLGAGTGSVVTVKINAINHAASLAGSGQWLTGVLYKDVGGAWLTPLERVTISWSRDGSTWQQASQVSSTTEYLGYDFEVIVGEGEYIPIGFNSTCYVKTIFNYNIDPTQVKVIVFEDANTNRGYDQGEPILSTGDFPIEIDLGFWRTVELEPIMFFDSIQAAISAADSGQTIHVYDGIYSESVAIDKPLSLIGSGNAVLDCRGAIMYPVKINTGSVLVQGFIFKNIKKEMEAVYIWVHGVSAPVTIQFNHFIGLYSPNIADYGIYAESTLPGGRCIIQYNEFEGMWRGVALEVAQGSASILRNKFHDLVYGNEKHGVPYYGAEGVYATTYFGKDVSELLSINNNEFYDYCGISIAIAGPYPDLPAARWTNVEIKNNRIESIGLGSYPEPYGISLTNGLASGDPSRGGVNNVLISNNTLLGARISDSIGVRMLGPCSNVTLTKNIISNLGIGVLITKRVDAADTPLWYTSNLTVNFNDISGSTMYGLNNMGSNVIDARFNWWGDATGPYHASTNPAGLGSAVSDNVNYRPWKTESQNSLVINGNWVIANDTTYNNFIITLNNGNLTVEAGMRLLLLNSELRFNFTSGNVTRGIKLEDYGSRIAFCNSKLYSITNQRMFFYHVAYSDDGKRDLVNITRSTIEDIGISGHIDDRLSGLHVRYGGLIFSNSIMQNSGDGLDVDEGWGSYANIIQDSIIQNVDGRGVDLRRGVCSNSIVKNVAVYNSTGTSFLLYGRDYIVDNCTARPTYSLSGASPQGYYVIGRNITVKNSFAYYTLYGFSAGPVSEYVKFFNDKSYHSYWDLFCTDGHRTNFTNIYGYHGGFGLGIGRNSTNVYIKNAYLERVGKINDGTGIGPVIVTPQGGFGLFETVDDIYVSNMTVIDAGRAIRVQEAMKGWGNTHDNITICNSSFQGDIYFDDDQESWGFKLINTVFGTVIYESGTKGNMTALFTFQETNMNLTLFFSVTENKEVSVITRPTYSDGRLGFTISAPLGVESNTKISVGGESEPTAILVSNGTIEWNYNASSKMLTLDIAHFGPVDVIIDWRIPGDVNGDDKVDASDLFDLGKAYGTSASESNWNHDCDFNSDDRIDLADLFTLGRNYGKKRVVENEAHAREPIIEGKKKALYLSYPNNKFVPTLLFMIIMQEFLILRHAHEADLMNLVLKQVHRFVKIVGLNCGSSAKHVRQR